ncbi:ATP-binding protein [Campylobacter sp. US33a]|uniref:ATP-binding protein n=1 Tax=Campylobacter sp. US33a TaxID=2498120 RepID=UPI001068BA45|nr:ATP-binding protein [Campylobacter sp. US33a]TEY00720.1 ATP-binding protein [Campylobacter sp. US33a]
MSLTLLTLGVAGLGATYWGFKKKDPSIQLGSCFFERLAIPIYTLLNEYHSNSGLMIDYINENSVNLNTPINNGEIFGIELKSNSNIHSFLEKNFIDEIISSYKENTNSILFYVIHKQGKWHKQYLLSYSKPMIKILSDRYASPLLSGIELLNVIHDLYLQNSFSVDHDKKNIFRDMTIVKDSLEQEPEFMLFKKAIRQSLYKSLNDVEIFQGFKNLDVAETNILKLFKSNFEGSIWFLLDFNVSRIKAHINKLINETKVSGNKLPFTTLKKIYDSGNQQLCLMNSLALFKKYPEDIASILSSNLKTSFIPRDLFRSEILKKTLLKKRDLDYDFLVKSEFLNRFIASCHKATTPKADIYGIDKNGGFVNFSFSAENFNPHSVIIARPGAGKSVSKQKIMSQMIQLDFETGKAHNLGSNPGNVKLRSYDIGFSDKNFIEIIKNNKENKVAHIQNSFSRFKYNLVSTEMTRNMDYYKMNADELEAFEADIQFAVDLADLILSSSSKGASDNSLTSLEKSALKDTIRTLYVEKNYNDYKINELAKEHQDLFDELIELGYKKSDAISSIKESKYDFLKKPLLNDVIMAVNVQSENRQIKDIERESFKSLVNKLEAINKIGIFSSFDRVEIVEADVLSMDLNNFKESSLFVPIFFCIFQKTYLRDREFALRCKFENRPSPKLFYAIEEAKNFFRDKDSLVLAELFDKVTLEARKYNVHLCFIVQNADHLPKFISKNIDTRIFLLEAGSKLDVIKEADEVFSITEDVKEALLNTDRYELCIWYQRGVFHMRFEISDSEMKVFNTNPNV